MRKCLFIAAWALAASLGPACVRNHDSHLTGAELRATHYSGEATAGGVLFDDVTTVAALTRAVVRGNLGSGPSPVADGRLARLAAVLGHGLGPTGLLPEMAAIESLARRAGLTAPQFRAFVVPQGTISQVADHLQAAIESRTKPRASGAAPFSHFGLAPQRIYGKSYWVVVLAQRTLSLAPFKREVKVGEPLYLRAQLPSGSGPLSVTIQRTGRKESIPVAPGERFDVSLPTHQAGKMQVEVSAKVAGRPKLLAAMPVYVGVHAPELESSEVLPPQSVGAVEAMMLKSIADERARAGVPSLRVDEALTAIARDHSAAMAASGKVGHLGADGSSPRERLQQSGEQTSLVFQNAGRTAAPDGLQKEFLERAEQRAATTHPEVTRVGVGVFAVRAQSRTTYYVTQLFADDGVALDVASAPVTMLKALNEVRAQNGSQALLLDEALSAVAQDAVAGYFEAPYPLRQPLVDRANVELHDFSSVFSQTAAVMSAVTNAADITKLPSVMEPDATHVGLAVAQGVRPKELGAQTVVLVTLGWAK